MRICPLFFAIVFLSGCIAEQENGQEDSVSILTQPALIESAVSEPTVLGISSTTLPVDVLRTPEELCIAKCSEALSSGIDLNAGPCLSNRIAEDWVCDIAHNPRIDSDNRLENRCASFANKEAHHFVELDPDCKVIAIY